MLHKSRATFGDPAVSQQRGGGVGLLVAVVKAPLLESLGCSLPGSVPPSPASCCYGLSGLWVAKEDSSFVPAELLTQGCKEGTKHPSLQRCLQGALFMGSHFKQAFSHRSDECRICWAASSDAQQLLCMVFQVIKPKCRAWKERLLPQHKQIHRKQTAC